MNEQELIKEVNRRVNHLNLRETVDEGTGPVLGGCRPTVIEKQRQLIAAGIDPSRLQPWTAIIPGQGLHGVLMLDGDTVLDSLNPWPLPKKAAEQGHNGYIFLAPWSQPQAPPANAQQQRNALADALAPASTPPTQG